MAKSYYTHPHRRIFEQRGHLQGAPNKIEDADLLAFLSHGEFTVVEIAAWFKVSRSAAYYRLRAMETEGSVRREPGPGRFDLWRATGED